MTSCSRKPLSSHSTIRWQPFRGTHLSKSLSDYTWTAGRRKEAQESNVDHGRYVFILLLSILSVSLYLKVNDMSDSVQSAELRYLNTYI